MTAKELEQVLIETVKLELELEKLKMEWIKEKERLGSVYKLELLQYVMSLAMIVGLLLTGYGVLEVMKHVGGAVPHVCMLLGPLLFVGWIVFLLSSGGHRSRIAEYNRAAQSYEYRYQNLLQDIEASKAKGNAREENDRPAD
ncbi:MAG: hypothetical protein ABIP48_30065 [Planctomycetota bacterium]